MRFFRRAFGPVGQPLYKHVLNLDLDPFIAIKGQRRSPTIL